MQARRLRSNLSTFSTTQLHLRNPWIVAFWSFAFPGCGNLVQNRKAIGLILVIWELIVNTNAKINLSIFYSLLGQFELAKEVVDKRWLLLYLGLYVYGIWDGFRGTIDLNKQYRLADMEDAPTRAFTISAIDMNFTDKRKPWLALVYSLLMPGLGHLYVFKVIVGLFMILWTVVVVYLSNTLEAIHYTLIGQIGDAISCLDMQWLMYIPSIYGFVLFDAYVSAVEFNKLMDKEQSKYLRDTYPVGEFVMPSASVQE
ncbi:hypothetical protein [Paenibacillus silvisoli]|uniref:hypothetical protein n=1 Tax=Paenibacillus silvisoli TaxID=3110539 RepID=UPI00280495EE|nr:hypothetical protein [Paenibacillus silvisoli]